jgi:hypothetical protein
MKYISYVVIGGEKYNRPQTNDSKDIQSFYRIISIHKMEITEIMMSNHKHMFLKNGKLHSYDTHCYYNPSLNVKYYANNGYILSDDEVNIFLRKRKIEQLKEKIK